MPTQSPLPDASALEIADNYNDIPYSVTRSPHSYRRRRRDYTSGTDSPALSYLPSPALTPSDSDAGFHFNGTSGLSRPQTPAYSGNENDDESLCFTKALLAPPLSARKDLDHGYNADTESPEIDLAREGTSLGSSNRSTSEANPRSSHGGLAETEEGLATEKRTVWRRRRELSRRISEMLCLIIVGGITLSGAWHDLDHEAEYRGLIKSVLITCLVIPLFLCGLYPLRVWIQIFESGTSSRHQGIVIPATFDPAPILYPLVIPILTSISLQKTIPGAFYPAVMLGLSAIPGSLVPYPECFEGFNTLHWLLSSAPLLFADTSLSTMPKINTDALPLDREVLVLLYPLHRTLFPPLRYLTTSSLLESELQLLAIALVFVMLLASSPQMLILKYVLWVGGLGLLVSCDKVIRWNVALERVPNWRFRRSTHVLMAARTFLSHLSEAISISHAADDGTISKSEASSAFNGISARSSGQFLANPRPMNASRTSNENDNATPTTRQRSASPDANNRTSRRRKRTMSTAMQSLLNMTPGQANTRKWLCACYVYAITVLLVLGPIRLCIQRQALQKNEPFAWAVGYLLGDNSFVQAWVVGLGLDQSIPLDFASTSAPNGWVDGFRWHRLGSANTRLVLFAYFAVIVALGIVTVLSLSKRVAVDTRRKVFHGTMVLLLMPAAFVDPAFLSLGLVLVLAVFLLLEVFRAGQLRPLSKPIAIFLGPYVDGRDLRGPVVVSHIFLLIGCAIPFWLSLAGVSQIATTTPALGWELETRDVSMLSGVICVGMGDAAASLIGRRFGRHKWPWSGGKSLEGSLAFAVAVAIGLVANKAWLLYGGWKPTYDDGDNWPATLGKASLAGMGASFTEAVLTGCNDNVIVPVVLWLLVRGIEL